MWDIESSRLQKAEIVIELKYTVKFAAVLQPSPTKNEAVY